MGKTILCKTCDQPTLMFGTKLCDRCYEVQSRLRATLVEITCDVCKHVITPKEDTTHLVVDPNYSEETCEAAYDLCPSCTAKFKKFLGNS